MVMERVLGWDCETFDPVNTKEPPATIQISGKNQVWLVDGIWLREEKMQKEANEYFALVVQNYNIFHAFMGKTDVEYLRRWEEGWSVIDCDSCRALAGSSTLSTLNRPFWV